MLGAEEEEGSQGSHQPPPSSCLDQIRSSGSAARPARLHLPQVRRLHFTQNGWLSASWRVCLVNEDETFISSVITSPTTQYRPSKTLVLWTFEVVGFSVSVVLGAHLPLKGIRSVSECGPCRGE